jgi:hypothetical protein
MIPRAIRFATTLSPAVLSTATLTVALALAATLLAPPAPAQTYTPQSAAGLSVTFSVERVGSGRVIIFGDVRNGSSASYERVVLLAEGFDEQGAVVSRGRAYVNGVVPGRGTASFECRIPSGGREKRFRVTVEAYQIAGQSP